MQKIKHSLHRLYKQSRRYIKKIKRYCKRTYRKIKRKLRRYPANAKAGMVCLLLLICVIVSVTIARSRNSANEKKGETLIQILREEQKQEEEATETTVQMKAESEVEEEQEREISLALPDNYEDRYQEERPRKYTDSEIEERLENLGNQDVRFLTILQNQDAYPHALLNNLCVNPNMIAFAEGYLQKYNTTSANLETHELEEFPLFIQWDERWGYAAYGNDVIGLSGCGPTCLSMVIVGLTKNEAATPDKLATYAMEHGYYESGAGTKWSFMSEGAYAYGVAGSWIPLQKESVYEQLQAGHPIICAMCAGDFTAEGHYIVIAGIENDLLRIYDPNSMERSSKLWDYETIESQISNLWSFEVIED